MLTQLQGVGNQKIKYKDHSNIEFDSLHSYITLAKKAISKFSNGICSGVSSKMLKDEEAISCIANAIMMADWRWDADYSSKNGTKKSKYSYRNQCAIWAIQTYLTKNFSKPKNINRIYSLDELSSSENNDYNRYAFLKDSSIKSPEAIVIAEENEQNLKNLVSRLLDIDILSDKQKDYIKLYFFEGYTFEKIGKKYNVTREAIRQSLNKALSMIRSYANNAR